jgi:hypothetical protein
MENDEHLNQIVTFLTDQQLAQLKRTSAMTGTPTSTLIRIAVEDYLKSLPKSFNQRRPEQTS